MHPDAMKTKGMSETTQKVILIGNPNVGKSVLFGLLTGRYVSVSNYPGTTVEIASGKATFDTAATSVVDTPGINNLIPMSEDERVTRDILLRERPKVVIQVADAKNLRRALLISVQLAEMGFPFILDLNMFDEAESRGISINTRVLGEMLGVDVVKTVAIRRRGIDHLMGHLTDSPKASTWRLDYGEVIEAAVQQIEPLLGEGVPFKRALALMLLAADETLRDWLHAHLSEEAIARIEELRRDTQSHYREPLSYVITQRRLKEVDRILRQVYRAEDTRRAGWLGILGRLTMHPLWGVPVMLLVLYLMYEFVGIFGAGTVVDWLENGLFGKIISPLVIKLFNIVPLGFLRELFVGEYGLITMALSYSIAIVLPVVGTFFIAFGILEDSGYLPRLAVMVNRIFKAMGLNGKAVLPMVLGLGCDTMATLTTRILDSRKERVLVTLLLALGVPCSAQLGVILGLLGGLSVAATLVWVGVVIMTLSGVGYLASKVLPGESSDFVLEVPPIRIPKLSNIVIKTVARIEWYLKEAVPLFFLGTFVLFLSEKIGLLTVMERLASPLVQRFLGLPSKATEAFLVGFLRRDYGAAGLFVLAKEGGLDPIQIVVSLVTITLFVPCIANLFVMIKERGLKTALAMVAFIFPLAFVVGGLLNFVLHALGVTL